MQDHITRRHVLKQLGLIAAGLAAACTPARVLVNAYPQTFDDDPELVDRVLCAFVTAVIPGAPADDPDLVRAFSDRDYPFAEFAAFFAADLTRRGERCFGEPAFERLTLEQRAAVIRDGLVADATTRKMYNGAVTLAQIAFYAGIYDIQKGCALIGFEGGYHWHPLSDITYPEPALFLAAALTPDGNAA
jgi:hypothetical protein